MRRIVHGVTVFLVVSLCLALSVGITPQTQKTYAAQSMQPEAQYLNVSKGQGEGIPKLPDPPPPIPAPAPPPVTQPMEQAPSAIPPASQEYFRSFYDMSGNPPSASGLVMKHREFAPEPAKIAYLTIDDGPSPDVTPKILEVLKNEGVKATFFVVGRQVENYPGLLQAEYEQGHTIGNHSYAHDYAYLYQSPANFMASIHKNEEIIYSIIKIRPRIIRAPGGTQGNFHIRFYNAVDAEDYLVFDWNVSTADTARSLVPTEQIINNVKSQTAGKDRVIILMHDLGGKTTTAEALAPIIRYLKEQGYSFGVLAPNVMPILFPGGFLS